MESASRIEAIAFEIVGSARMRLVDEVVTLRRLARANSAPPGPILTAAAERKQIVERQAEGATASPEEPAMNQAEYIEILLNDCGIDTIKGRNAYLSSVFHREVKYLDDYDIDAPHGLTAAERRRLIDILKDKKAGESDRDLRAYSNDPRRRA